MNYFEAIEALEILSDYFKIKTPILKWSERESRGKASYSDNSITLGPKISAWKSLECTLLHEFAHLLTDQAFKNNFPLSSFKKFPLAHGKEFQESLLKVIKAWFNDINKYDFKGSEYIRVSQGIKKLIK
jgi:predicted SprT family Zn-dependent metalloprotease